MGNRVHGTARARSFALLAIFAAALVLRMSYVGARTSGPPVDTDSYRAIAHSLISTGQYAIDQGSPTAYRAPGYPLVIAAVERVFGGPWAVIWFQCLLSAAVCFPVARIARGIVGDLFSPVAALIVAVDPFQIAVCGQFMTEAFFGFLVVAAFSSLLWAVRTRSAGRHLAAGLVVGAAAVTRPEFLVFGPGALVTALIWGRRRRKLACLAALGLGLVVPSGLWGLRNRLSMGSWIFTTTHGGYTHLLPYNEVFEREVVSGPAGAWHPASLREWQEGLAQETAGLNEVERDTYYYGRARDFAGGGRLRALRIALYEASRFWGAFPRSAPRVTRILIGAFYILLVVMALGGAWAGWRRGPLARLVVYMLVMETFIHMYYWSNIRMRVPFHPLLAVLAAVGIAACFGRRAFIGEASVVPNEDPLYSPAV